MKKIQELLASEQAEGSQLESITLTRFLQEFRELTHFAVVAQQEIETHYSPYMNIYAGYVGAENNVPGTQTNAFYVAVHIYNAFYNAQRGKGLKVNLEEIEKAIGSIDIVKQSSQGGGCPILDQFYPSYQTFCERFKKLYHTYQLLQKDTTSYNDAINALLLDIFNQLMEHDQYTANMIVQACNEVCSELESELTDWCSTIDGFMMLDKARKTFFFPPIGHYVNDTYILCYGTDEKRITKLKMFLLENLPSADNIQNFLDIHFQAQIQQDLPRLQSNNWNRDIFWVEDKKAREQGVEEKPVESNDEEESHYESDEDFSSELCY